MSDVASFLIREEKPADLPAIRTVNELAFGQKTEADIVDRLRESCQGIISLVAEQEGKIAGHLLFSPVAIENPPGAVQGMGLGPMAVLPECQRQGIGAALVWKGLFGLKDRGCAFVLVLGHPEYYPRFGFEPASRRNLRSQWQGVPDEAFMVLVLDGAALKGVAGVARFRQEFDSAL
jgi:putative acetyltransferase